MSKRIRVTVVQKADRKYLQLRFRDSLTGETQCRSAETSVRREAERKAALWEDELRRNGICETDDILIGSFKVDYTRRHLASLADTAMLKAQGTIDRFREIVGDKRLASVHAGDLSEFQSQLRDDGLAESTIAGMLRTLQAAFNWAKSVGLLQRVPAFPKIARAKTGSKPKLMKGRPITARELVKMLRAAGGIVGEEREAEWRYYIRGLWFSGLRLRESIILHWERDDVLAVDLSRRRPMLRIPAEREKGNQDRLLPITPDFAAFLLKTPPAHRQGFVFKFMRHREQGERPSHFWVSHIVSQIGKAAGIVVDSRGPKYASAHDIRRSFGDRWSRLVMPQVLMEIMRHESINTTLRFYVARNAEATADALYAAQKGSTFVPDPLRLGSSVGRATDF